MLGIEEGVHKTVGPLLHNSKANMEFNISLVSLPMANTNGKRSTSDEDRLSGEDVFFFIGCSDPHFEAV